MKPISPTKRSVLTVAAGALALMAGAAVAAGTTSPSTPAPARPAATRPLDGGTRVRLPPPEYLSLTTRELLHTRMQRHGDDMMVLMAAVLMLQYDAAEDLARTIGREPRISRPGPGELDTLNQQLPPRFFDFQERLVEKARAVADAARTHDDAAIVKAYGSLAETCVGCHSAYLHGEPKALPAK